jgi:DNA (cytosine-5)-methyltransferase 1
VAKIPIIDLFAGPGGLGEGFSRLEDSKGNPIFDIKLSIEKDFFAHQTLQLRSFFRKFGKNAAPPEYYDLLRENDIKLKNSLKEKLFEKYPLQASLAEEEAWNAELGSKEFPPEIIDKRISRALGKSRNWVLIGGPPCQAYSIAGRSRVGGISETDPRVHLYKEYLRIIAKHSPAVFVMENVKGLLSSKIKNKKIFDLIKRDLNAPSIVFPQARHKYKIFSLTTQPIGYKESQPVYEKDTDFLIKSECYGVPQKRHRVILLGIRDDIQGKKPKILIKKPQVSIKDVIGELPKIRSGISRVSDHKDLWKKTLIGFSQNGLIEAISTLDDKILLKQIHNILSSVSVPHKNRGGEFVNFVFSKGKNIYKEWYHDTRLGGICNYTARSHMAEDLKRYLFAVSFAVVNERSPKLEEYPESLLPKHKNAKTGHFNDRFRVQIANTPASTITSHIAKDGHYFIHYDPTQCRTLTVREAARIQTFPDNYFFCGSRTAQYVQVGNAVPPLLANKISKIVLDILN